MKHLLIITLAFFILFSVKSQDSKWEISGDLGLNLSTMSGNNYNASREEDDGTKHKWIATPNVGFAATYLATTLLAVTAGLYMIKSGVLYQNTYDYLGDPYKVSQRIRFTTLRLPIMLRLIWGDKWQYYAMAGIYLSWRLCGREVYKNSYDNSKDITKLKFKKNPDQSSDNDVYYLDTDLYKRFVLGMMIGGGIRHMLGPGYITLTVMYGMGFCDFYKWENKDAKPNGYKPYNDRNISINAGYTCTIGKR